ncbi:hypothetical protein AC069_01550 [Gardnerella vaginalis]|uniref:hypothetical protein n=1 Tax=Gardnerella TaxID=2701 RepID=UPI000660F478|nr:hypothetical protein [Gardnerella vaginalis]KMT47187.1 hypothetical protein AC069_01550 [Gardnerella vaginalis]
MYKVLMFVLKLVMFTAVNFMVLYLSMVVFGHDFGVMFKTYGNALGPFTFVLALMTTMSLPNEGTIFEGKRQKVC